jgi:hypothetical protein
MTETQAFVEISSRSAAELAEKYVALWNEPDAVSARDHQRLARAQRPLTRAASYDEGARRPCAEAVEAPCFSSPTCTPGLSARSARRVGLPT